MNTFHLPQSARRSSHGSGWRPYGNRSGNSPIVRYAIDAAGIEVEFVGGGVYRYDHLSLEPETLESMKRLAVAGQGLAAFIRRYAYRGYAYRIR